MKIIFLYEFENFSVQPINVSGEIQACMGFKTIFVPVFTVLFLCILHTFGDVIKFYFIM